jgi:uncharacterized protein (DUF433 family)
MFDFKEIISINSKVRFGKPCIRNTRISVFDILSCLESGMTHDEILVDYPELQEEDILVSLAYAANGYKQLEIR